MAAEECSPAGGMGNGLVKSRVVGVTVHPYRCHVSGTGIGALLIPLGIGLAFTIFGELST